MPPVIIAGVIAAGAAVAASKISSDASNAATDASIWGVKQQVNAQETAADKAAAAISGSAQQARQDLAPFRAAQLAALGQAQDLTNINSQFYNGQREVNTMAIQRQLAAQGLLRSKKQSDLLTNLELGLDQQRAQQVNSLANLGAVQQTAQLDQGLGQGLAQIYSNQGQNVGSAFQAIGQISAQGRMAQGQATASALTGIANAAQGTYGNYLGQENQTNQMKLLQALLLQKNATSDYGALSGYQSPPISSGNLYG